MDMGVRGTRRAMDIKEGDGGLVRGFKCKQLGVKCSLVLFDGLCRTEAKMKEIGGVGEKVLTG